MSSLPITFQFSLCWAWVKYLSFKMLLWGRRTDSSSLMYIKSLLTIKNKEHADISKKLWGFAKADFQFLDARSNRPSQQGALLQTVGPQ